MVVSDGAAGGGQCGPFALSFCSGGCGEALGVLEQVLGGLLGGSLGYLGWGPWGPTYPPSH